MKFYFRPNGHWNIIPETVYLVLEKFYGHEHLKSEK
jgi:hypothetical protein